MAKINVTRGSKAYTSDKAARIIGLGPNPKSNGLPRQAHPVNISIDFELAADFSRANVRQVKTVFAAYDIAGETIVNSEQQPMNMNEADKVGFETALAGMIEQGIQNGYFRKILGYNRLPVYGADGLEIVYTLEQQKEEKTEDYDTHNADGTPINGAPADSAPVA